MICVGNEGFAVSIRERIKREGEAPAEPYRAIVRPVRGVECDAEEGSAGASPSRRILEGECVADDDHAIRWNRSACTLLTLKKLTDAFTCSIPCPA
jgi:hypothetical protein